VIAVFPYPIALTRMDTLKTPDWGEFANCTVMVGRKDFIFEKIGSKAL
jgi:hypothetical protein